MDILKIRKETPGIEHVTHLNSAGSSLMPAPVYAAVRSYEEEELIQGGYETMMRRAAEVENIYLQAAEFLNAEKDDIALVDSATTAWQRALFSIDWKRGDEIITGNAEYASNYISFLRLQKWFDVKIRIAQDNEFGETGPEEIEAVLSNKTKLVSVTHMPTINGLVNPIEAIGDLLKGKDLIYLVDACQSVGHYPLDVKKIGCDFLSGTGRKYMRAPRGTGLLYVSEEMIDRTEPLSLDLYSAQWDSRNSYSMRKNAIRFEQFEANYAIRAGLGAAMAYQNQLGIENTWKRIQELATILREKLNKIKGVKVQDRGRVLSGIVTATTEPISPKKLMHPLIDSGINVTAGSTVNSRLYMEENELSEVLRVSVHYFNTEEDINKAAEKIDELLNI